MQTAVPALNRNTTFRIAVAAMFIFFLSHSASAQDFNHMNFSLGAGFSTSIYNSGSSLNYGWNFNARGGVALNSELLADLDFTCSHSNFNNATLAKFGEPNGGASIWSLTFNPVVRLAPRAARFRPYITGPKFQCEPSNDRSDDSLQRLLRLRPRLGWSKRHRGFRQHVQSRFPRRAPDSICR